MTGIKKGLVLPVLLLFVLPLLAQEQTARVKFLIGEADLMPYGKTSWNKMALNGQIRQGDRIRTRLASRVELEMPDKSVIRVNENSIFDVSQLKNDDSGDEMSFTLWAGNMWAKFSKAVNTRQSRKVESPSAVVAIRGTELEMMVNEQQTTIVRVFEGRVAVTNKQGQGEVFVESSQETEIRSGEMPSQPRKFEIQEQKRQEAGLLLQLNQLQRHYTDQSVLGRGVEISGQTSPGAKVTANGVTLTVSPNGNIRDFLPAREGLNEFTIVSELNGETLQNRVGFFVNTQEPQIRFSTPLVAGILNRRDYSLSGAIFDPTPQDKVRVFINGEIVADVEGRGSFNRTIILNEGKNTIQFRAVDRSENVVEKSDVLFLDTVKPIVTITQPANPNFLRNEPPSPPDKFINLKDQRFTQEIRGIIIDPEPSSGLKGILINGQPVKPRNDGSFEADIQLVRGENRILIQAEDLAGNIVRESNRVITIR